MQKERRKQNIGRRCFLAALALLLLWPHGTALAADWEQPPAELARLRGEEGKLVSVEYVGAGEKLRTAHAGVYYPAGYDEQERYDVVFLWPGTMGDSKAALGTGYPLLMDDGKTHTLLGKRMLDRMIEFGYTRPFLLVCLEDFEGTDAVTAGLDIRTMLSWVRENCAVYTARDGLTQAEIREHYILLGYSQGSIYAEGEGMVHLFEEFSVFGAISYGSRWDLIPRTVDESPYPLRLLYALVGGKKDQGAELGRRSFEVITSAESVTEGENAILRQAEEYDHGYSLLLLGLTDMLPRVLPPLTEGGSEK